MTDHYAKLCDNLEFDRSETPIPESSPANTGANSLSLNSGRRLKAAKLVKILVISQLIAGLLIFGCGSMCLGVTIHSPQFESDVVCAFGTGIWVGLSCTASGLVGIFLLRKKYSKSLTVTFMVTSIVSSIFCGIEVIFSGIWLALLDRSIRQFSYMSIASRSYHDSTINSQDDSKDAVFLYLRGNLALNSIACLSACINMIICIVSAAMMCGNLCGCCGAKDDFAAVFVSVPTSVQSGSAAPTQQVILVPYKAYQKHPDIVNQVMSQTATKT